MVDRGTIEALLREAYEARKRGDVEGIRRCFVEHPHFELAGAAHASPVAVRAMDGEGFRAVLSGLVEAFEFLDHEILSLVVDGPRAAVHARARVRARATGEEVTTQFADIIAFENGRIASFVEFCDTALAAKMMGA
jgi:ketosteroid isomerase-like protein